MNKIRVLDGVEIGIGDRVSYLFQGKWYDDGRVHRILNDEVQVMSGAGGIYHKDPSEVRAIKKKSQYR